jgi:hypothetical protein
MSKSLIKAAQEKIFSSEVILNSSSRTNEKISWLAISIILVFFALTLHPVKVGDGQYYFAMLKGLAANGSPEITEEIRTAVKEYTGVEPVGLTVTTSNGHEYAAHFFAYPLLCLPAYVVLEATGIDTLKAFQVTNALIVAFAFFYIMLISRQKSATRWALAAGFLFSTGIIYFQWPHPEVFSAALVLTASVAFLDRRYALASLMTAVSALQNPSIVFFVLPIIIGQSLELHGKFRSIFNRKAIISLAITGAVSLISLAPYMWNYIKFGHPSLIVTFFDFDPSLITPIKMISFVFDLNQGLIIGLPLLLWAVPLAVIFRVIESIKIRGSIFRREDLFLFGFLLIVIPTLAQSNWNSGHSVFLRYASWAGMAPLVWVSITIGRQHNTRLALGLIPALAIQLSMQLYVGGFYLPHHYQSYLKFQPWITNIWNRNPHFYDPLPEIFYERLVNRESEITTPAIFRGDNGEILRVLTVKNDVKDISEEVCGGNEQLVPWDERKTSKPTVTSTEMDYYYLTGRLVCAYTLPADFSFTTSAGNPVMLSGWSYPEPHGTWSLGKTSSLQMRISRWAAKEIGIRFKGYVFLTNIHKEQVIYVYVNSKLIDVWTFNYPSVDFDKWLTLHSNIINADSIIKIDFLMTNAISPRQLGLSADTRLLGISLNSVYFEKLR